MPPMKSATTITKYALHAARQQAVDAEVVTNEQRDANASVPLDAFNFRLVDTKASLELHTLPPEDTLASARQLRDLMQDGMTGPNGERPPKLMIIWDTPEVPLPPPEKKLQIGY